MQLAWESIEYIKKDLINSANHLIRDFIFFLNIHLFSSGWKDVFSVSVNAVLSKL